MSIWRITVSGDRGYFGHGSRKCSRQRHASPLNVCCGVAMIEVCLWSKKICDSMGFRAAPAFRFRKFNRINFRNDIASHCWDHVYNSTDPNDMWLQWKCSFLSIVNKHAPLRTMRVRTRSSPWITSSLRNECMIGIF